MSLNKNFTNPFLRNRTHNGKFGHAIQTTNQTNTANNREDTIISNILRSIHKSPFMKKVLYNAIGLTLMAATQGFAGDIKGVTGTTVNYLEGTKTYQITTADAQIKNGTAFNGFTKFQLAQGEIANMFYKNGVNNIVNFVKEKIDIQGVLNTIKSTNGLADGSTGKIGGNLYFLSSNGLIIGKTGVVNTGSFYAIVPSAAFMNKFLDGDGVTIGNDEDVNKILERRITGLHADLKDGTLRDANTGITLAPGGEIIIEGTINALNGIGLYAGGKVTKDSVTTGGLQIKDTARILTQSQDAFQTIVNTSGVTLTPDVDFISSDGGNIELVATGNTYDGTMTGMLSKFLIGSINGKGVAEAEIVSEGEIKSRGDIIAKATANNGDLAARSVKGRSHSYNNYKSIADLTSKINIKGGSLEAKGKVTIKAITNSNVAPYSMNLINLATSAAGAMTPINLKINPIVIDSKAQVDVNGTVTAGTQVNIVADTYSDIIDSASTASAKINNKLSKLDGKVPTLASVIVSNDTTSTVNIGNKITSKVETPNEKYADINVQAIAENRSEAASTAKTANDQNPGIAVTVTDADSKAVVNINENAQFDTKGNINISSELDGWMEASSEGAVGNGSIGAAALTISNYDTTGEVNIKADIAPTNSVGSLTVMVYNNIWGNSASAETSAGLDEKGQEAANNSSQLMSNIINRFLPDKVAEFCTGALELEQEHSFNVAAALTVANGTHEAKVTIEGDKNIKAGGELSITAVTNIEDIDIKASAGAEGGYKESAQDKRSFAPAIIVSNIDHKADVLIKDSLNSGTISGETVEIKSEVNAPYNRVGRLWENVTWAFEVLKAYFSDQSNIDNYEDLTPEEKENYKAKFSESATRITSAWESLKGDFANLSKDNNSEKVTTWEYCKQFFAAIKNAGMMIFPVISFITDTVGAGMQAWEIVKNLLEFTDYTNYFNVGAIATVSSSEDANTTSIAGSFTWASFDNKSNVLVGRRTKIISTDDSADSFAVNISSKNDISTISLSGAPIALDWNTGGKTAGGHVMIQKFISDALVLTAEDSSINAGNGNVAIQASNIAKPTVGALATSKGAKGFDGIITYIYGDSSAKVLIDDETNINAKKVDINTFNHTQATNISGAVSIGNAVGVGAGIAITDLEQNSIAAVKDNDKYWKDNAYDSEGKGSSKYEVVASQTVQMFNVAAKTTGTNNTIAVAGGVTMNDDSGQTGAFSRFIKSVGETVSKPINYINDKIKSVKSTIFTKLGFDDLKKITENRSIPEAGDQEENEKVNPSFSLEIAGSVGLNFIDNTTEATIDKANIKAEDENSRVAAEAINSGHNIALAGAVGFMWNNSTKEGSENQKTVGINGAAGANSINNDTTATISNTKITNANYVDTLALNGGETVAAALGASVTINSGDHQASDGATGVDLGVSVNDIDNNVTSNMLNNTVTGDTNKTNVAATAYESDLHVTGGVSMSAGQQANAAGANIDVSVIKNTLNAKIEGGNYDKVNNVSANALQATTQVNAAIALAVTTKAESQKGFSGAAAYSKLVNTNTANINNATITTTGQNGIVTALARDVRGSDSEVKVYEDRLVRNEDQIDFIDKEGKSFYENLEDITGTEKEDSDGKKTTIAEANVEKLSKVSNDRKGQIIVTAAAAGTVSGISVGAGVAITDLDNTFTSTISNSTITSNELNSSASNNGLLISVAGGVAVSKGDQAGLGGGSGSVAWNTIENSANANVIDSEVHSNKTNVYSSNDAYIIGVSGQISANIGSGASAAAAGASVLFNEIENKATSVVQGGKIASHTVNGDMLVNADNNSRIIGVSAGAVAGTDTSIAVGGTVVINKIENDSEARIGSGTANVTQLKDLNSVTVKALDKSDIKALSGQVTISQQVAAGGAVAVNTIKGDTKATIEKANLGSDRVDVEAESKSKIMGLSAGFALSTGEGVSVEGAAVTGDIFRDVTAKISNSDADNTNEAITVKSDVSEAKVQTIAAVVAGSMGPAAIGAGVAVNRIEGDVNSTIEDSRLKVKNAEVISKSAQEIITIGAAGAGSNTGVGVAGSFAYNKLGMDTTAAITKTSGFANDTYIIAQNNIGVVAQSDDDIRNYAGVAGVGFGGGVGLAVGINMIDGDTKAVVDGADLTAKAKDDSSKVTTKGKVADDKILDEFVSKESINIGYSLSDKRESEENTGVVVDSSSTHTLKSLIASIAGGGTAGVSGNVSTNFIDGSTEASVKNANINKGVNSNETGNVTVKASDYTNSSGFIGSVAIGGTAGIGLSADSDKVSRSTSAKMENIKEGSQAKDVKVNANSKQGISSFVVGINGSGVVNVGGSVAIGLNSGKTEAAVTNAKLTLHSLDVEAKKLTRNHVTAGSGGGSLYGGLNTGVSVANDLSTVKATVLDSTINMASNQSGNVNVNAENDTKIESISVAAQGGAAAISGAISVNYEENKVISEIKNSTVGSEDKRANNVEITAKDLTTINGYGGGASAGVAGVGAAVNINTFDGQVTASADNAKIYAGNKINIDAKETRDGEQQVIGVAGGIAGIDIHVIKVNSGKAFDQKVDGKSSNALNDAMLTVNNVVKERTATENDKGRLTAAEKAKLNGTNAKLTAEEDGKSITSATVRNNSLLDSKNEVSIEAKADGEIVAKNINIAGGLAGVVGTVGSIKDNKNVKVAIADSTIKTNTSFKSNAESATKNHVDLWQGSAGIVGGNGANSMVNMTGNTLTSISNTTVTSNNSKASVNINTIDKSEAHTEAHGLTVGGLAIGGIVSRAKNESYTATNIDGSKIELPIDNAENSENTSSLQIKTEKANRTEAESYASTNGAVGVGVIKAYSEDKGNSTTLIGENNANTFKAKNIEIGSSNEADSHASMGTTVSIAAVGIGVGLADTILEGKTNTILSDGNTINSENTYLAAYQSTTQNSKVTGNAIGLVEITSNDSDAKNKSQVNLLVGKQNYNEENAIYVEAINSSEQKLHTDSTTVGGIISMGYNKADADSDLTANVSIAGATGNEESKVKELYVVAGAGAAHNVYTNGDGGGIINIDGFAAFSQSHIVSTTNTNISGNWNVSGDFGVASVNDVETAITAEAWKATVLGYSGTHGKNYIETYNNLNIADNSKINANNIELYSINSIVTKGTEQSESNAGASGYGGITVNGSYSTLEATSKANINIGKSSNLTAAKNIEADAVTYAELKNKANTKGGAFWGAPIAKTYTVLDFSNKIDIGDNAHLLTTSKNADISLAATDYVDAQITATADMKGGFGGDAHAMSEYDITKTNEIEVSGEIKSKRDVNLYTDQTTTKQSSEYNLVARADAYNKHSAIALAFASLDGKGTKQTSKIRVNEGANIESIRHVNMSVTPGIESTQEAASEYTWYKTGDPKSPKNVASTASGKRSTKTTYDNQIIVDGKVTAGYQNKIGIVIGNENEIVDPTQQYKESDLVNFSKNEIVSKPTITYKNNDPVYNNEAYKEYKDKITVGTMNYANELFKRYKELRELAQEYQGTQAGIGYEAEVTRVLNEMKERGLYDEKTDQIVGDLKIAYVELPEMISSGGNINIDIDDKYGKISGKGTLEAKGAPEISVENNSNLYLKVNDLTIEDYGGNIILNDVALGDAAPQKLNQVATVKTDSAKDSSISITENWDNEIEVKIKTGNNTYETKTFTPITNIEINGRVKNEAGSVNVYNQNGDIVIQGKNAKTGASINAAEIHLTASKGAVAQGYTEGVVNIGSTPEIVYKNAVNNLEAQVIHDKGADIDISNYVTKKDNSGDFASSKQSSNGTWIAGGAVYINADAINVNGLIQSGYSDYEITLGSEYLAKIESFDQQYGNKTLTDSQIKKNCKLNNGGVKQNTDGSYYYEIQAYYNPNTKEVILESIDAKAGAVYLTGTIANTAAGSGKIYAADGASDIKIKVNEINRDLVVNKLNSGDSKGVVLITDTAKGNDNILAVVTEYRSTGVKQYTVAKKASANDIKGEVTYLNGANEYEYAPASGLYYHWTNGSKNTTKYTWAKDTPFYWWGGWESDDVIKSDLREHTTPNTEDLANANKKNGNFVGKENISDYFTLTYDNCVDSTTEKLDKWTTYDNWTHFSGDDHVRWYKEVGSSQNFNISLKADNPIKIKFLQGSEKTVSISAKQDIKLQSDIKSNGDQVVSIKSNEGSITQNSGEIKTSDLRLEAKKDIGTNEKAIIYELQSENSKLTASSEGIINVDANDAYSLTDSTLTIFAQANADETYVKIASDGNLAGKAVAERIDLTSRNGSVGASKDSPFEYTLNTQYLDSNDTMSSSLNVSANKDIYMATSGETRVGNIASQDGNVYLSSDKGFVTALSAELERSEKDEIQMVERWKAEGIIGQDGKDNSEALKAESKTNYEAGIKSSFNHYMALKTHYEANPDQTQNDEYKKLANKFGNFESAEKWLEEQYKDTNSDYYKASNEIYGWTQDQLLYALQKSIINKETGSTKTVKGINIKGNNVTLVSSNGGIGKNESSEQVDISDLNSDSGLETLKKLARSEASDIRWQVDLNGNTNQNAAVINHTNALGLDINGNLTVTAKDNVYVADASTQGSAITIDNITSQSGNVRIYGKDGVYSRSSVGENEAVIKTNELILEGGSSSVGTKEKPINVDVAGTITARSDQDVNIKNVRNEDMVISAIYAGKDANLTSNKGITSVYNGVQADELGYINVKGTMNLTALNGNIGSSAEKAIRIANSDGKITGKGNNAYIKAQDANKSLHLGDLDVDELIVNSEGDLILSGEVKARQKADFYVDSLGQDSGSILADNGINIIAKNGISLSRMENVFSDVTNVVNTNSGNITINGSTSDPDSDTLKVKAISNNGKDGDINISTVSVEAESLNAKGDISVSSTKGTAINNATAGGSFTATSDMQIGATNIKAGKNINIANTSKNFSGVFGVTTSMLEAGGKVSLASEKGVDIGRSVNGTVIKAGNGININSKTDTRIHGTIEAENGNIDINGGGRVYAQLKNSSVISDNGDINVTAGKDISLSKTLAPNGNITLNAGTDVKTTFIQANKASVKLGDDADFGKIDPKTKLTMTRTKGTNKGIFVAAVRPDGSYELVRPDAEGMANVQHDNDILQGKVITTEKATEAHTDYQQSKDRKDIVDERSTESVEVTETKDFTEPKESSSSKESADSKETVNSNKTNDSKNMQESNVEQPKKKAKKQKQK